MSSHLTRVSNFIHYANSMNCRAVATWYYQASPLYKNTSLPQLLNTIQGYFRFKLTNLILSTKFETLELSLYLCYEEMVLSFTHCSLEVRKIFSSIIREFSWVSRLKNGSQGSFWGLGRRLRPRNGPRVHFSIKIPKKNRELYEMNFLTLRENHAWRRMLFYIWASFCSEFVKMVNFGWKTKEKSRSVKKFFQVFKNFF